MSTAPSSINHEQNFHKACTFYSTVAMQEGVLNGNAINTLVPVPVAAVETVRETTRYIDGAVPSGTNYYHFDVMGMSGNIVFFYASLLGAPTTTDELSVDIEHWNGSSWASVLAAPLEFDSADVDAVGKAGSIVELSSGYANGDKYRIKTVGTGSSANDLVVKAGYVAQGYSS